MTAVIDDELSRTLAEAAAERAKRATASPPLRAVTGVVEEIPAPERMTVPAQKVAQDLEPVNWPKLWSDESPDEDWLAEPIIPRGRQVAIYSQAKVGKSLLALDIAAAMATGRSVLGQPCAEPVTVIYLDLEMTPADLRERLGDLGYGPETDLSCLIYYQLPNLPPLDTDLGGQVLEALVAKHQAALVVLDTMARVVEGAENEADTYRDFYRHTGRRLKAARVSLFRLDHAGKELSQGPRGSSGKVDDVDIVFQMNAKGDKVIMTRTHSRVSWVPSEIVLRRETEPALRHVLTEDAWPAGTTEVAALLDQLDVGLNATVATAMKALRAGGGGKRNDVVGAALKWRRAQS